MLENHVSCQVETTYYLLLTNLTSTSRYSGLVIVLLCVYIIYILPSSYTNGKYNSSFILALSLNQLINFNQLTKHWFLYDVFVSVFLLLIYSFYTYTHIMYKHTYGDSLMNIMDHHNRKNSKALQVRVFKYSYSQIITSLSTIIVIIVG